MKSLISTCLILFPSYSLAGATHFNLQNQILSIPFAVLAIPFAAINGVEFYENIEIMLDQDTGFLEVIRGFELGPPTQVFEFGLKLGESVKLFNAPYTTRSNDSPGKVD